MSLRKIGAASLRRMMGGWRAEGSRVPAYREIEQSLKLLILDGQLPIGVRLPGERNLAPELGVSRTTISAAYAALKDEGFLESRHGSGSVTRLPGGASMSFHAERGGGEIDFSIAALPAPKEVHAAYTGALAELPRHLPGIGYEPAGLPDLRSAIARHYERRGLPTSPDEIMVTQGAQHGLVLLLGLLARPGVRVAIDNPSYSKAIEAIRNASCQPIPVALPDCGWNLDQLEAAIRQGEARLSFLLPDFHNPTGRCMSLEQRRETAAIMARTGCLGIVDETMVDLWLEEPPPPPLALFGDSRQIISIGSMGKSFWGGLRMGWIRGHRDLIAALAASRAGVDMGSPLVEQLAAAILLEEPDGPLAERRAMVRPQRDHLLGLVASRIPEWRFRVPPGGLSAFAEMPMPVASALAAAAHRHGVRIAPGSRFGVEGGFDRFVRLPYALPVETLTTVVDCLVRSWEEIRSRKDRGAAAAIPAELIEAI